MKEFIEVCVDLVLVNILRDRYMSSFVESREGHGK